VTSTARVKAWRAKNPERQRAHSAAYYKANAIHIAARQHEAYLANPEAAKERAWAARLKREYGITPEQYFKMLTIGGGLCWICQKPPKKIRLHVDHDHETLRVRGLACYPCNRLRIGRSRAGDAVLHQRIAEYLVSDFDGRKL
jgi:hypothetical protein